MVKQIKITSQAQSHQFRYLSTLKLKIILQKFTEADQERGVPLRCELTKEKKPPDKGSTETFREENRKCGRCKQKTGDCSNFLGFCPGGRL